MSVSPRAVVANVHATCVRLARAGLSFRAAAGAGILILGRSGAGKSDLALRLIAAGAELVSDDRTELFVRRGRLFARPPKSIAGQMEIRGIGIVNLPHAKQASVLLVVELARSVERMPHAGIYRPPQDLRLTRLNWPPLVKVVAHEASAPAKVMAAVAAIACGTFPGIVKPQ